jgi:hypothetical protein
MHLQDNASLTIHPDDIIIVGIDEIPESVPILGKGQMMSRFVTEDQHAVHCEGSSSSTCFILIQKQEKSSSGNRSTPKKGLQHQIFNDLPTHFRFK